MVAINPFVGIRLRSPVVRKYITPKTYFSYFNNAKIIRDRLNNKNFIKDDQKCYHVYNIKHREHKINAVGLVATVPTALYSNKTILPHEDIIENKIQQHVSSFLETRLQINPILLIHRHITKIHSLLLFITEHYQPELTLNCNGFFHSLWRISSQRIINKISQCYQKIDRLYIADGHHRISALDKINQKKSTFCSHFLSLLISECNISVCGINRGIKKCIGLEESNLFPQLKKYFMITDGKVTKLLQKHEYHLFFNGKWFLLSLKRELLDNLNNIEAMDSIVIQKYFLNPILSRYVQQKAANIIFLPNCFSRKHLEDFASTKNIKMFICLPEPKIEDIINVADNSCYLPPHSTCFIPKPLDGLISIVF